MTTPVLLAAGAIKTAVEGLLAASPSAFRVAYGTAGALRDRVLAGEAADAVATSEEAMGALRDAGLLRGEAIRLGAAATAVAVRDGAPRRPVHDADSLRAALLNADGIAWADPASGATGGRHFARVIEDLGIADAVRAKSRLFPFGVEAVAACGRGEAELAVSQATEIVGRPGVWLLGPLPPPYALSTAYAAAMLTETPAARDLLDLLTGEAAREALAAIGFTR